MNKYIKMIIVTMVIMAICIGGIMMSKYFADQQIELTVEVCHKSADIEIAKCQSYENGCINPKVLINVVSDNPGTKATVRDSSGFYLIRDHHHGPKTIYLDEGETRYETFGCDKKEE